MTLNTFLRRLKYQPVNVRHDEYEKKDILEFEKKNGYFPYLEIEWNIFLRKPQKCQNVYFDVLNHSNSQSNVKYINNGNFRKDDTTDFIFLTHMRPETAVWTIDQINKRLASFYMMFN